MLETGTVINDTYRVERLLGSGGMADVYLVTHTRMPRQFALKVMRIEGATREKFLERFTREVQILATIRNAHIVDVVDSNHLPNGSPYLVMELLEGEDLSAYIIRTGPLAEPVALKICSQVGEALMAAHSVGVVHRDLKPSNIFLSNRGPFPNFVKVLDFGIAKLTQQTGKANLTAGGLMGTPAYMSPEQARGKQDQIDARTDQFALAAVLYEMISGRAAFAQPEDTVYAILDRVINQEPEPLPQPQLWKAIKRAISKNADDRFSSLKFFLGAVGATSQTIYQPNLVVPDPNHSTLGSKNGEVTIRAVPQRRKRLTSAGLSILAVVALFGVWRHRQQPAESGKPVAAVVRSSVQQESPQRTDVTALPTESPPQPGSGPAAEVPGGAAPEVAPSPAGASATTDSANDVGLLPEGDGEKKIAVQPAPTPVPGTNTEAPAGAAPIQPKTNHTPAVGKLKASGPTSKPSLNRSGPLVFVVHGVTDHAQDNALRGCLNKHLAKLTALEGSTIKLERSGSLQVVDAPPSVYDTNFDACLEQAFALFPHAQIPKLVFVKAIR